MRPSLYSRSNPTIDGWKPKASLTFSTSFGRNADARPRAVVGRIAVRHDGVQPVVAARQLEHDEDALGMLLDARALQRLRGQRRRRAAEEERQPGADADAVQPGRGSRAASKSHMSQPPRLSRNARDVEQTAASAPVPSVHLVFRRAEHEVEQFAQARAPTSTDLPRRNSTNTARSFADSGTLRNRLAK